MRPSTVWWHEGVVLYLESNTSFSSSVSRYYYDISGHPPPLSPTVHSVHHAGPRHHRELRSAPDVHCALYVCMMCIVLGRRGYILFGAVEVNSDNVGSSPCVMRWGGCLWLSWSSWAPRSPGFCPRSSGPASTSAPRPRPPAWPWCWPAAWAPAASPWRSSASSWPPGPRSWRSRWCWAAWGRSDRSRGPAAAWAPAWCDTARAPAWSAPCSPASRRGRGWWTARARGRRAPPWRRSGWRSAPRPGLCPCLQGKYWLLKI